MVLRTKGSGNIIVCLTADNQYNIRVLYKRKVMAKFIFILPSLVVVTPRPLIASQLILGVTNDDENWSSKALRDKQLNSRTSYQNKYLKMFSLKF